jgi:hypothetical protein
MWPVSTSSVVESYNAPVARDLPSLRLAPARHRCGASPHIAGCSVARFRGQSTGSTSCLSASTPTLSSCSAASSPLNRPWTCVDSQFVRDRRKPLARPSGPLRLQIHDQGGAPLTAKTSPGGECVRKPGDERGWPGRWGRPGSALRRLQGMPFF